MSTNIIKNCQMKYNSFLKTHRDIKMSGAKRYKDKSGEYYLQNSVKYIRNNKHNLNQKSHTKPIFANNKNNKNLIKVNRKLLFDELVPIPKIKQENKSKCDYEQKNLNNAVDNAKYIRRYQYSKNLTQKQIMKYKENKKTEKIFLSKIKYIQVWWKTIFLIIKIQKFIRGALFRIKLVKVIQNKEKYFEKITNLVNKIKKIFCKNFFVLKLINQKPYIRYYFKKWKEKIFKKSILNKLRKYLIREELCQGKYKLNKNNKNSRSYSNLNKAKDKINLKTKEININNSLNNFHNRSFCFRNSSQPLLTLKNKNDNNKNKIALGLGISLSSRVLKKNKNNKDLNKNLNRTKISSKNNIDYYMKNNNNNDIINPMKTFSENRITKQNNKNNDNNINLNSSQSKISIKSYLLIEKNKNILSSKKNKKAEIIKNNLEQNKKEKNKKNSNIHKRNNKFKIKSKAKKNKVYQNELFLYYNKYQTIISSNEDNYFSVNKDLQEFSESNLNESQFNDLLNNSSIKENPSIFINYEEKNKKILFQENSEKINSENKLLLKKYFEKWMNENIIKKIIKKLIIIRKINLGKNIIIDFYKNKNSKSFFRIIKSIYKKIKAENKFQEITNKLRKKIIIKNIISFCNKYHLYKYFIIYKNKIYQNIILEKLKQYLINKKKEKEREKLKNNTGPNFYILNEQFSNNIPINSEFINNNLNLTGNQANSCFIINNLNYNNNTNNIDIKLSYDNNSNNLRNIHSHIFELAKKNNKPNKPYIGLYKRNNNPLIQNINKEIINQNQNINIFPHNHIFIKQNKKINNSLFDKEKDNHNKLHSNLFPNEDNLNKSLVLSKYSNQLNWNLITKKNQLIMIINIIERQRKLKELQLLNESFGIWKNKKNYDQFKEIITFNVPLNQFHSNYINNTINTDNNPRYIRKIKSEMNEDIIKLNAYEKKINLSKNRINEGEFNKFSINNVNNQNKEFNVKNLKISALNSEFSNNPNNYYTYSAQNLSDFRIENTNKNSIYRKKAITGSFNCKKKNEHNEIKNLNKLDDEYIIYKKQNENMSPENYFGFKKYDKIEEMEISFGDVNKNKNKTNPVKKNKTNKFDNIKIIKPFNAFENPLDNYQENNNGIKNIIIEDLEENNELDKEKENFILNLYSYFEVSEKEIYFYTINDFRNNNICKELDEKLEMKKSKSENILFN